MNNEREEKREILWDGYVTHYLMGLMNCHGTHQ